MGTLPYYHTHIIMKIDASPSATHVFEFRRKKRREIETLRNTIIELSNFDENRNTNPELLSCPSHDDIIAYQEMLGTRKSGIKQCERKQLRRRARGVRHYDSPLDPCDHPKIGSSELQEGTGLLRKTIMGLIKKKLLKKVFRFY
jgi:hypothetical protein